MSSSSFGDGSSSIPTAPTFDCINANTAGIYCREKNYCGNQVCLKCTLSIPKSAESERKLDEEIARSEEIRKKDERLVVEREKARKAIAMEKLLKEQEDEEKRKAEEEKWKRRAKEGELDQQRDYYSRKNVYWFPDK